jgi:hypothetical protein
MNGRFHATTAASPSKSVIPGRLADGPEMTQHGHDLVTVSCRLSEVRCCEAREFPSVS